MTKVFERAPLLIQRSAVRPDYYTQWFSSDEIRRMLREDNLKCARSPTKPSNTSPAGCVAWRGALS